MTTNEYINCALQSIELYLDYIEKQRIKKPYSGKSVSRVLSRKTDPETSLIHLHLNRHIFSLECIELNVKGLSSSDHWREELRFVKWDEKKHLLTIHASGDLFSLIDSSENSEISVTSDMKFLTIRLREWYKNREYSERISLPSSISPIKPPNTSDFADAPSDEQSAALNSIFLHPLTYIWGAPGTGKTKYVLSYALMNYIKAGKKVIVTAPTNNAVDQTLLGVLRVLEDNGVSTNTILRLGVPGLEISEKYPHVCEQQYNVKRFEELKRDYAEIQEIIKIRTYNDKLSHLHSEWNRFTLKHQNEIDHLDDFSRRFYQKKSALSHEEENLANIRSSIILRQQSIEEQKKKADQAFKKRTASLAKLQALQSASSLVRLFKLSQIEETKRTFSSLDRDYARVQRELETLQEELSDFEASANTTTEKICQLKASLYEVHSEKTSLRCKLENDLVNLWESFPLLHKISEKPPCPTANNLSIIQSEILNMKPQKETASSFSNVRLPELSAEALSLKEQIDNFEEVIGNRFEKANVISATTDTLVSRYDTLIQFSDSIAHIFMDEAAYSPIIKAMVCYSFGCPVTFLGDHMQLPPVCEMNYDDTQEEFPLASLWFQSSVYSGDVFIKPLADVAKDYAVKNYDIPNNTVVCTLNHSFRFGEKIASVLAECVYTTDFHGTASQNSKIIVLNVKKTKSIGRKNPGEAAAIQDYLLSNHPADFSIITPYLEQVSVFEELFQTKDNHQIMTVHASQGREWDVVFFSVSDTTNMFFTNSSNRAVDGLRVINTAVSRAKKVLVIACDYDFWIQKREQFLCKIIDAADTILPQ